VNVDEIPKAVHVYLIKENILFLNPQRNIKTTIFFGLEYYKKYALIFDAITMSFI
jgi:hypothetical protein